MNNIPLLLKKDNIYNNIGSLNGYMYGNNMANAKGHVRIIV